MVSITIVVSIILTSIASICYWRLANHSQWKIVLLLLIQRRYNSRKMPQCFREKIIFREDRSAIRLSVEWPRQQLDCRARADGSPLRRTKRQCLEEMNVLVRISICWIVGPYFLNRKMLPPCLSMVKATDTCSSIFINGERYKHVFTITVYGEDIRHMLHHHWQWWVLQTHVK